MFFVFLFLPSAVSASTLRAGSSSGTFTVGSTFTVNVLVDTEGETINTVEASLGFPADKLQLVSPTTGQSIISLWLAQPKYNNQTGRVDLLGGITGGTNVGSGLITTLEFRVKSVGPAIIKFLDNSKVLLHDGKGTESLKNTVNGVYQLVLPPPAGPIVSSDTHPDQQTWYTNRTVSLVWAPEDSVDGYSYILNDEPVTNPDDISEGIKHSIVYKNLDNGIHFFHIKGLKNGGWGGVTHFAIKVDTEEPADFPIEIIPGVRTTRNQPVIQFGTTDVLSGVDHYDINIIPLKVLKTPEQALSEQQFFVEAQSPYVTPPLELGTYNVIVRAYDKAGNFREVTTKLNIVTAIFTFVQDKGLQIKGIALVPWSIVFIVLIALLIAAIIGAWRIRKWHRYVDLLRAQKELPKDIKNQLEELKKYKNKYGKALVLLLIAVAAIFGGKSVLAQQTELDPPYVSTVSKDITNEEIFYIGGKTDVANTEIIIYLQNLQTGETNSFTVVSDKNGSWFYRHNKFLADGDYIIWVQGKIGELVSPPSPQILFSVRQTALQFGASRISYELLYLIVSIVLLIALASLIAYIIFHAKHGRRKHGMFVKEVHEAEESVRRGFAVLRRDIEAEIAVIRRARGTDLSAEEKAKEAQLLRDLESVERYIGKEIWDVEKVEGKEE